MQDYPNRAAALAGAGLPPEPGRGRRRADEPDRRPAAAARPTRRWRARSPRSSAPATPRRSSSCCASTPSWPRARLGDPAARAVAHAAARRHRLAGARPGGGREDRRAGRRGRRRQRALHRPAHRDAAALGGQQRRRRSARRAAGRRRRHRSRRRRHRRRHADGRRRRLRPVEGRAAAAGTRRAHQPLAGRRARPPRPRPRRARRRPPPTQEDLDNALWCAAHGGQRETAELLLDRGADPAWVGHDELTAAAGRRAQRRARARGLAARAGGRLRCLVFPDADPVDHVRERLRNGEAA